MGHFGREWHRERSKDNRNWNQGSSSKAVRIEDASEKAMYAIDGAGFDWSDMAEEEIQANMALRAFSDSEYDNLLVKLDDTGFKASTYKSGLSILEGQNFKYKESEILFSEEIALLKRSVGHKEYLMGLLRTELEKVKEEKEGFEFKIAKFEKSAKDLDQLLARGGVSFEEFKQPEVNEYGPRDSSLKPTTGCDKESDNSKENTDDSLKQQQKTDSKTSSVKTFMKMMRLRPVNTVRSVNTGRPFNAARSFNTVRPSYTAHPKSTNHCARPRTYFQNQAQSTVHMPLYKRTTLTKRSYYQNVNTGRQRFNTGRQNVNTVRARGFNVVKPSACWVWRPIKPNGASLSNSQLNDKGFVDSGCSRHMTGNIAHLSDFKDFDGGYVTFGGGAYGGRITGKEQRLCNLEVSEALLMIMEKFDCLFFTTIDGHSMSITEASLRRHLKLDDQDGITSIPNSEIFEQLALMGYHTDSDKLTFQKGAFSPQWRFIHICLDMQRKQLQQHSKTYPVPSLSIKVFNNMKRPTKGYSSQEVALFPTMLVKKLEARVKIGKARRRAKVVLSEDDKDVEDDSSKQWKKLTNSEVQEKASTASEVLVVSTAEENLSTARRTITYRRRSEEKRIRKDKGKAIMTEETNARDEEIARQWDEEERQRAMAEAKLTKKIDWNDPSVIRLVKERYSASRPEGYDYLSFGDECKLYKRKMKSDGKWKIQHEYNRDKLEFI
ncbi:hypothetical protein Tco_0836898 [Tanacetum coccineum]